MLFLCIGSLLLGAVLRLRSLYAPLDVICFMVGGFFGLCFLLKHLAKAIWRLIRKPLAVVAGIVLIAMVITLIPIKIGVESQSQTSCDFLIVLGCKVKGGAPSPVLQYRINTAYDYLTAHPGTICIVSGGQGSDEDISEAQCMFNELTAMGIAPDRIWLEDQATCTSENFAYTLALLKEKTGNVSAPVAVLSSEFHLYRASLMAEKNGLDAVYIAAPTLQTETRIGYTLREIFALWKYLLIGE